MQSDRKFFACSEYAYIFFCLTEFLLQNIIDTNTHTYRGVGAHAHKPTHICVWLCVLLKLESGGHFLNFSLTWSTMTSQTRVALTPPRLLTRRTRRETPGPVRKLSLTSSYLFFSVFFFTKLFSTFILSQTIHFLDCFSLFFFSYLPLFNTNNLNPNPNPSPNDRFLLPSLVTNTFPGFSTK